ncbi:MAG: outer membrane protein assembly factor BamA [Gammaproteobacteria bacterium]|nr:outer membrane protein assembly factor BamA [Gammaproteobacteria bacterium]MCB1860516.1 outer membrane protein assembly factor BamA [Gammaproteobacteria bacterium]MCB1873273.1 outer membrane protein assembly factor BamA [Gammaproteobacteria bacterium]
MKKLSRFIMLTLLLSTVFHSALNAAEPIEVTDIRIEGLQRISAGTVFNYLPVRIGQRIAPEDTAGIIRELYKTGFFKDVRLEREAGVLIVTVTERPAIAKIDISGNKSLETDQLLTSLKDIGLAEGRVLNRFVLDQIEQELGRLFFNLGKYGVEIETQVTPLERNRVAILIEVREGVTARIKKINIVGNQTIDEEDLLDEFELSPSNFLSFISKDDQYSRQKLSGDLEKLRSYYLDRGYINFEITSTQVSITPNKQDIYITINLNEGDVYKIRDIKLTGELVAPPEQFYPLIHLQRNSEFSRKQVLESSERINGMLGDLGYAFANVNNIPDIDEDAKEVDITFFIDPGKRVYVRRVNMGGNNQTRDEVLRREMRQLEAAWFSAAKVKESKKRLQRLDYFEEVHIETPAVAGSTDQVDVNVRVTEKPMGNLGAGVGFSQSQGAIFNASISQNNFLGTGKRITAAFNTSDANKVYSLGYTNPYYTVDGISRGFNLSYRETDFSEVDTARYLIDSFVAGVTFGVPTSETDRLVFDLDIDSTKFKLGETASEELSKYQEENGKDTNSLLAGLSWSHDSRDSALLPTEGGYQRISGTVSVPGSDLEYYTLEYVNKYYIPLSKTFTLGLEGNLGYGDSYGSTTKLPPWRNFFGGGRKTVRGFKDYSLGPRDSEDEPLGGNLKVIGNLEVLFPAPFKLMEKSVRLGLFVDAGNVYDITETSFDAGEFRYSTGISGFWLSPFGAFGISFGFPLNDEPDDETEIFQFAFGSAF